MYLENMFGLQGKVAIVTGAKRGIGQVIALGLAQAGAQVVLMVRTPATETERLIAEKGGTAYSVLADVTNEQEVDRALNEVMQRSKKIDIVFNNAGICMHQTTMEATVEEFRQVIDTDLTSQFIVCRAVGKIMLENKFHGSIINMASMSGSIVNVPQMQASYNTAKAGVIHLTRSLAVEWADSGIRVNSLSPGYVGTPMSADTPQELRDAWMPLIPLGRMAYPEELIPAVLYLACDASGYTTGSDVIVDGGYVCR